jgi:hypothetical protein
MCYLIADVGRLAFARKQMNFLTFNLVYINYGQDMNLTMFHYIENQILCFYWVYLTILNILNEHTTMFENS